MKRGLAPDPLQMFANGEGPILVALLHQGLTSVERECLFQHGWIIAGCSGLLLELLQVDLPAIGRIESDPTRLGEDRRSSYRPFATHQGEAQAVRHNAEIACSGLRRRIRPE